MNLIELPDDLLEEIVKYLDFDLARSNPLFVRYLHAPKPPTEIVFYVVGRYVYFPETSIYLPCLKFLFNIRPNPFLLYAKSRLVKYTIWFTDKVEIKANFNLIYDIISNTADEFTFLIPSGSPLEIFKFAKQQFPSSLSRQIKILQSHLIYDYTPVIVDKDHSYILEDILTSLNSFGEEIETPKWIPSSLFMEGQLHKNLINGKLTLTDTMGKLRLSGSFIINRGQLRDGVQKFSDKNYSYSTHYSNGLADKYSLEECIDIPDFYINHEFKKGKREGISKEYTKEDDPSKMSYYSDDKLIWEAKWMEGLLHKFKIIYYVDDRGKLEIASLRGEECIRTAFRFGSYLNEYNIYEISDLLRETPYCFRYCEVDNLAFFIDKLNKLHIYPTKNGEPIYKGLILNIHDFKLSQIKNF